MSTYQSIDLGSPKTDDSGYFSITYDQIDLSDKYNPEIHIFNQFLQIDGIPINQNVNKNLYNPTYGTLQIYLYTKIPLEANKDTLFLGHYSGNTPIIDTLVNTFDGLYKTYKLPVTGFAIFWWRNSTTKGFDSNRNRFTYSANEVDASITGDPVIDKMTINY